MNFWFTDFTFSPLDGIGRLGIGVLHWYIKLSLYSLIRHPYLINIISKSKIYLSTNFPTKSRNFEVNSVNSKLLFW